MGEVQITLTITHQQSDIIESDRGGGGGGGDCIKPVHTV